MEEPSRTSLPRVLGAGAVVGVLQVSFAVTFGTLVYGAAGTDAAGRGIGFVMAGAIVTLVVTAVAGPTGTGIGSVQDVPGAVMALVAAGAVAATTPDRALATVAATVLVAGVVAAAALVVLGVARLGDLARYVPFPVVAGMLGATGWLLLAGGVQAATGVAPDPLAPSTWTLGDTPSVLLVGMAVGGFLLLVARLGPRGWELTAGLAAVVTGVHAVRVANGASVQEAVDAGWLLDVGGSTVAVGLGVAEVGGADWGAVLGQLPGAASLAVLVPLALLLNVAGHEAVVGAEADLDRELRIVGGATVAVGLLGGVTGFLSPTQSSLARRIGGDVRAAGLAGAVVVGLALVAGPGLVRLMPVPVVVGLLVYLGIEFLLRWAVGTRVRMPWQEHAVVLLIVAAATVVSFLTAVVLGLAAAVVLFVRVYAGGPVVHARSGGAGLRSRTDRPPADLAVLAEHGDEVHVVELRGYVFFGSAHRLVEELHALLHERREGGLHDVVLDLRRVHGIDATAVQSLVRARDLLARHDVGLVLSDVEEPVDVLLRRGGLADVPRFDELDVALHELEDRLLRRHGVDAEAVGDGEAVLRDTLGEAAWEVVRRVAVPRHLVAGTLVVRAGDTAEELLMLVAGRLTVRVHAIDGEPVRLRTVLPGAFVGGVGLLLDEPRSADVVAEVDTDVLVLDRAGLAAVAEQDAAASAALHAALARALAVRLRDSLAMVRLYAED